MPRHRRLDLVRRRPGQDQRFDPAQQRLGQGGVVQVLVVPPGDEDQLLGEGLQPGDGAGGAGGDGIVVPLYAVQLPHEFNAVLHPGKGGRHPADLLRRNQPPHRGDGRQHIFHIVQPRQTDLRSGEQGGITAAGRVMQQAVAVHPGPALHRVPPAEPAAFAAHLPGKAGSDGAVGVQHRRRKGGLVGENIFLGGNVFLHRAVNVQVVGGNVGHHGDLRALPHRKQLEGGKLHHGDVVRLYALDLAEQRPPDVAAQMHRFAALPQHFGDEAGGGCLAVAARHPDHRAGAALQKQLQLAGDGGALPHQLVQARVVIIHPRRAEDDIPAELFQVVRPGDKAHPHRRQLRGGLAQLLGAFFVVYGHIQLLLGQQAGHRTVADPQPDQRELFSLETIENGGCRQLLHDFPPRQVLRGARGSAARPRLRLLPGPPAGAPVRRALRPAGPGGRLPRP